MTKRDELNILAEAIEKLGPDSYLGPWLLNVSDEVERQIRSDFFPMVSLKDTREQCEREVADAKKRAQDIIEAANIHSNRVRMGADNLVNTIADNAIERLRSLKR